MKAAESDSDSSDEEAAPVAKKAAPVAKAADSDSSSDEEEAAPKKAATPATKAAESDSDSSSDEEEPKKEAPKRKETASTSDSDSSEDEAPAKRKKTVELEKPTEEAAAPAAVEEAGSKCCFVKGLPYSATEESVVEFFKECGEGSMKILWDRDSGESKGCGFMTFTTRAAAVKALELHEQEMDGRWISVTEAEERPAKGGKGKSKGKGNKFSDLPKPEGCLTVFVSGLNHETTEDTLWEKFGEFGTLGNVSIMMDRDTQMSRGLAFIDYTETDSTDKAVAATGVEIDGWNANIRFKQPKLEGTLIYFFHFKIENFKYN